MGQILGLGITHYPNLAAQVNMSWRMQAVLADPKLPEHFRAIENWPPAMLAQWGTDRGQAHSDQHRQDLIEQFRRARAELDAFKPDFVLIGAMTNTKISATIACPRFRCWRTTRWISSRGKTIAAAVMHGTSRKTTPSR